MKYQGIYTALVTPFDNQDEVDFANLENLIEFQMKSDISGLVLLGTTGEAPSLSREEKIEVLNCGMSKNNGKQIIVGIGGHSLESTKQNINDVYQKEIDCLLLSIPPYINPSQEGIYRYIKAVSDFVKIKRVDLDIMIYNIPARVGRNIEPDTFKRIVENCSNVVAVKDASTIENSIEYMKSCKTDMLSGNDNSFFDFLKIGGNGIVSVVSNIYPQDMHEIYNDFKSGKEMTSRHKFNSLLSVINALSLDTNPITAKCALSTMGLIKENYRLPLCKTTEENKTKIAKAMEKYSLE